MLDDIIQCIILAVSREKASLGFLTRCNTNGAEQPQKMVRGLKFRIYELAGLSYPRSESKDTDQLDSYHQDDCIFVFACAIFPFSHDKSHISHIARKPVFEFSNQIFGTNQVVTIEKKKLISFAVAVKLIQAFFGIWKNLLYS